MAKLILSGNRSIEVRDDIARKIIKKKKGNYPPDHNLDIQGHFIELGRIKEVMFGDFQTKLQQEELQKRNLKIAEYDKEWKEEDEEFQKMNPKQKAMKMIRTYCWLAYKSGGNKMSFDEWNSSETAAKIFDKIKKYFEQNETDYCPPRVYVGLIPKLKSELIQSIPID